MRVRRERWSSPFLSNCLYHRGQSVSPSSLSGATALETGVLQSSAESCSSVRETVGSRRASRASSSMRRLRAASVSSVLES